MHVPGAIFPLIADLALYAEIWVQCTAFAPTVFHHASAYDKQAEKTASRIAGYSMVAIEREVYALCDKDNEKGLRGGHKVHHSEDVLDYPIDKPRTKARNERMQRAESNLGNFWNEFDKHVKMHCPKAISHCWETQWPQTVELKRTQDWVDAETGPVLSATPFSFGDEKASKTEETSSVSKNRKKKRRNGKVLDSPKTDALLADTPPAPQIPAPEEPPVKISAEAWRVVEGGLFYAPKNNDNVSEIPWSDFLEVMRSLGFTAQKMFGLVWRFQPGDKAKAAGFDDRSIDFHKHHGPVTKLTRVIARRIGRRLNRAYGIDVSRQGSR